MADLCQPGLTLRVLLAGQVLAAALVPLVAAPGRWLAVQSATALAVLLGSLVWLAGLCAMQARIVVVREGWRAALAAAWGGMCAVAAWLALGWVGLVEPEVRAAGGAVATGLLAALGCWRWFELRTRLMQPALTQARLAQLQARIRPHFLFNSLNAALALVRVDPDRAERVLEDLSVLFREVMSEERGAVPLSTEIELARRYLDVEQVRFGDRLRVSWSIDAAAGTARVPPLVLQPLVENAVKHGVEPSPDGCDIHISTQLHQGLVHVVVSNTLGGVPSPPGSGMALENVAERLKLLHDMAAHVGAGIETAPGVGTRRFVAHMSLPL
jgi:two-component system sensor histidine kinase AlgZ